MEILLYLFLIALVIALVVLVLYLIAQAFRGAILLLDFALEQGFVGLVAYIASWTFLFPVMLIGCIILGIVFT